MHLFKICPAMSLTCTAVGCYCCQHGRSQPHRLAVARFAAVTEWRIRDGCSRPSVPAFGGLLASNPAGQKLRQTGTAQDVLAQPWMDQWTYDEANEAGSWTSSLAPGAGEELQKDDAPVGRLCCTRHNTPNPSQVGFEELPE